jgi:DNA helicase-2/ATP-dependent DNA helicase PcrA
MKSEKEKEQERVDFVTGTAAKRIAQLEQDVSRWREQIVDIRRHFWEDVTVNIDNPDDLTETYASIKQQAEVLAEREHVHRHSQRQLKMLRRLKDSPYFGRIDFRENGSPRSEQVYIGITSLLDDKEEEFLVYDWRAPISSMYYDYATGPASYETPAGTISGTIDLKRQFIIQDGQIRTMFDTGITIGDELLQEVLGKSSDAQLRSIVSTIQKEQNQIIRNEEKKLLIVQGAAGSGKTSAALQRVAYLLYKHRSTLNAEQIVLFSPNPMFNSYVSTVLPELGEENMQQTTFQEYLEHRLGRDFLLEDPFAQMEFTLTASDEPEDAARIAGMTFKASNDFLLALLAYLDALGKDGMIFKPLTFRDQVVVSAEQMASHFYSLGHSLPVPNRVRLLAEWLIEKVKNWEKQERNKPWVREEVELMSEEDYRKVYQALQKKNKSQNATFNDYKLEEKLLGKWVVRQYVKPLLKQIKRGRFVDTREIYKQLFADPRSISRFAGADRLPANWETVCRQTVSKLERSELFYEDAAPYLLLEDLIKGFRINTNVKYVFIDEAQDYSPLQFAYLMRLFPRSKMTVLGDINQAIFAHSAQAVDFGAFANWFDEEETETIRLTRSYRSTREIVEFTKGMIPDGEAIVPFNRSGKKPTVTLLGRGADLADLIAERIERLAEDGHRTIAVICKTDRESQEIYRQLAARIIGELRLQRISKSTASFSKGVMVIPSYLAKGVEFDAVIIPDASADNYCRESERRLFYTCCTRAMHELHLFSPGELSPFVAGLPGDTYELRHTEA